MRGLSNTWRIWLPPVVFALAIFAGAVLLSGDGEPLSLVYRVF
jgi:hypothetical protein